MNIDIASDSSVVDLCVKLSAQNETDIMNEIQRCKTRIAAITSISEDSTDKNIFKLMDRLEKQQNVLIK